MTKQFSRQVLIVAVGCLFLSSCIFQTSSTTVKGKVTEYGKKPVVDAEISFGGAGSEIVTRTQTDGTFTVTARHRPTQMLRLEVKKKGFVMREKVEFPGFAAPEEPIEIELMQTVSY
jgi:hypothetical protein